MQPIDQIILNKQLKKEKRISERSELIKYFVENLRNKNGKPFSARMIAIKMSHLSLQDIRYMISVFKDNLNRKGLDGASKEFWWSLRSNKTISR